LSGLISAGEEVVASELMRFELVAGVRPRDVEALEAFFSALDWLPVDEQVARRAGLLAGRYRHSHRGIDDGDYVIAATAMLLDARVLTTNVRHFPMFERLAAPY